jgi:apolipoprotein D and lipocalin family protein
MCKPQTGLLLTLMFFLAACTGKPDGVEPVTGIELERYLGNWYEIALLDHCFERCLDNITAVYSRRDDGGVRVINRGYSRTDHEWQQAEGKAYFVADADTGYLKVSFFGPFYGSYIIFALDKENYRYAFISGPDTSYLWLLARSPQIDSKIISEFTEQANQLGFDTSKLIYVDHDEISEDKSASGP